MRVLLMSLVLTISASSFANTSLVVDHRLLNDDVTTNSSALEGYEAREVIAQLEARYNQGDNSIETYSSQLMRGVNGDFVLENISSIKGKIGSQIFDCESHRFTIGESSGENDSEYTNNEVCYVK